MFDLISTGVFSLSVGIASIFIGLFFKGLDRRIAAKLQGRIGPPLRQPFRDVKKLFLKENIVPAGALAWLFNLSPLLSLASSLIILIYIPLFGFESIFKGDLVVLLYLFLLPSIFMILGGFSSGSPYAILGSQREVVLLVSLELPLAIAIITIGMVMPTNFFIPKANVFSEVGMLGKAGFMFIFFSLLAVIPSEFSRIPFDLAEAETEIAHGLFVEYSGRNLGLFYIADGVKIFAFTSLLVALFLPHFSLLYSIPLFFLEVFGILFFGLIFCRVAFARLKIDQASFFYMVLVSFLALLGLLFVLVGS